MTRRSGKPTRAGRYARQYDDPAPFLELHDALPNRVQASAADRATLRRALRLAAAYPALRKWHDEIVDRDVAINIALSDRRVRDDNKRHRTAINRWRGLPDRGRRKRTTYDAVGIVKDWHDLTQGDGNERYPTRGFCGLAEPCEEHGRKKPQTRTKGRLTVSKRGIRVKVQHRSCPACVAYYARVGRVSRREAITAIARVRRFGREAKPGENEQVRQFQNELAVHKFLERQGVRGLPALRDR